MLEARNFYRFIVFTAILAVAVSAAPALAQSLDELRASGAVGERFDGYAQALSPSAKATVKKVNEQRKKIYQTRAGEQGVSPDQIGRVYAQQIFAKAPAGTKFLQESGSWITK